MWGLRPRREAYFTRSTSGRFSDTETRWLYFLVSFMGTAMVGTGLVMWTVKRRQKLPDPDRPYFGFRLVERLNIASIAGLSIAMTAFLWGNRLLPHPLEGRADLEIHLFFFVWALTLLHALVRPARSAWVEQLWTASALLFLLPVLNALTTQRPLWHSLVEGDWIFVGMDIMCWTLALLHAVLAIRTARQKADSPVQAQGKPAGSDHRRLQRGSRMSHLLAFVLCLAGFAALAFAMRRQQRDIIGRSLRSTTTYVLRVRRRLRSAVALGVLVAWKGWSLGLVMFSGHTSIDCRYRVLHAHRICEDA